MLSHLLQPPAPLIRLSQAPQGNALLTNLLAEATKLQAQSHAPNTQSSMSTALHNMMEFLLQTGVSLDPRVGFTPTLLTAYATWMATAPTGRQRLKPETIRNYISLGPRIYHLQHGLPWTEVNSAYPVQLTIRGINRLYSAPPQQVPAMTTDLLLAIREVLFPLQTLDDVSWWAAALLLFFSLLRSCHVVPDSAAEALLCSNEYILRRASLRYDHVNGRITLLVSRTKTIQFHEKLLRLPLPLMPEHPLDPTNALLEYLRRVYARPANEFLFGAHAIGSAAAPTAPARNWVPLTYERFTKRLRELLSRAGIANAMAYTPRSFRRGGATLALRIGLAPALIQALGDWRSDVYMTYCQVDDELRSFAADAMAADLIRNRAPAAAVIV